MRVITGFAKGVNLNALSGVSTRPTSSQVKEAIFSAIQARLNIEGTTVLDLFAGSGQLGIEALSRGAKKAYFSDNNPKATAIVYENLRKTGFSEPEKAQVAKLPYTAFLRLVKDEFDIAFIDPPYGNGIVEKALALTATKMKCGGIIVCEHEKNICLPEQVDKLKIEKVYNYGTINLTIYRYS